MNEIVIYLRIVLYSLSAIILVMFAITHRDRTRRLRNLALSAFFLTIVTALIARIIGGAPAQNFVNDWLTTTALIIYVVTLVIDFYYASTNGGRKQ